MSCNILQGSSIVNTVNNKFDDILELIILAQNGQNASLSRDFQAQPLGKPFCQAAYQLLKFLFL